MIRLLCVLILSMAAAHAAEKSVKLSGVVGGMLFGKDIAFIEAQGSPGRPPETIMLGTGQSQDGIELVSMDAAKGKASVKVDGEPRELVLEPDEEHPSTHTANGASSPLIHFRSLPLLNAISLYADCKNRTALIHPQLGKPTFSINQNVRTKAEAAEVFEKMFAEQKIATIPDGEHFVMVVPNAFTNPLMPRPHALSETNFIVPAPPINNSSHDVVPPLSINFHNAPIFLVLQAYSDFMHKEIVNLHDDSWLDARGPYPIVTLVQTTPLSREEICYALQTLIEWNNVRIASSGDGNLKLERISSR